jgi:hypothetical protein
MNSIAAFKGILAMAEKDGVRVFISYSRQDRPWVAEFTAALRKAGVEHLFDIAEVRPGEPWQELLEAALRNSRTLILILTPTSVSSPWTLFELGAAIGDDKRIIPVVAGDLDPREIPQVLRRYQLLTEASPQEAGRRVAETLAEAA